MKVTNSYNEKQLVHLMGEVEDTGFSNPETGYIVLDMNVDNELVTAVGEMGDVRAGERLSMYGEYVNHPKYGRQFRVEIFERSLPTDLNSIRKYLGSGIISGVGPSMARKITDAFGDKSLEIIETDPMQLASIKGINAERAKKIGDEFHNITGLRKVMTFFSKYSIPHYVVSTAWKIYGTDLIRAVEGNPYCMCAPEIGLRFADAERIARDLNFPFDSEERVYAGIIWALNEKADEGSCCIRESELANAVTQSLIVSDKLYCSALQFAEKRGDIVNSDIYDTRYIYLKPYFDAETYISRKISEMIKLDSERSEDFSNEISIIADGQGIEYEEHQTEAINACMNNHIFILTGGPGTGKTTTLKGVIELYRRRKIKFKLAAPTGRAAKRMADLTGAPAQTIHRLLEVDFVAGGNAFKRNEENPLSCDAVIIDEMSMVDTLLFASLLRALKSNTKLIMVGDSNQLPSVGAGNILRDLLESEIVPSMELTEIFRQAQESLIVTNAHAIIHGELPVITDKTNDFFFMPSADENVTAQLVIDLCKTRLPKAYGYNSMDDIQVLCLSRMGTVGTENLNRMLQAALNPSEPFKGEMRYMNTLLRAGDKIMQTKNDYDIEWRRGTEKSHGIFNGDIGKILNTDNVNQKCGIDFEGRQAEYSGEMLRKIEHAYAMTVHKSQGSEYPAVIIPLPNGMDRLSYRNLLYTAVTRARKTLIIIGMPEKISGMVYNDRKTERFTCLKSMLEDEFAE
ncbi:MAG: ATP-dependent RecD-like DNA helicase [Oscillospiraceae bacterium]|nr:ATP-dependent RecD-like DNA helicase [Oscillospiraceae bacterium]